MCTRGRQRRCGEPGCREWSARLCDFKVRAGKTCDRPLCPRHAHRIESVTRVGGGLRAEDTVDFCPTHFKLGAAPLSAANDDDQRQLSFGEVPPPRAAHMPAPPAPKAKTSRELAQELVARLEAMGATR